MNLGNMTALKNLITATNNIPQMKIWGELANASKIMLEAMKPVAEIGKQLKQAAEIVAPNALIFYKAIENGQRTLFEFEQNLLKNWNDFEKELKTQNRYFPNCEFTDMFEKLIDISQHYTLRKGTFLYRARKIDYMSDDCGAEKILHTAQKNFGDYEKQQKINSKDSLWEYIENIPADEWENNYTSKPIEFWGYDAEKSDAPTKNATQGRINPIGISYLYTARDINTAISEIQPTIEQIVSVAKIKTSKKLKLFCFDFKEALKNSDFWKLPLSEYKNRVGMSYLELKIFFDVMSRSFSKPVTDDIGNYYATQYISEFIKKKGFDGIKYKSSLREGGYNIVLFDISKDETGKHENYEILNSSLHRVSNVRVTSKKVFPRKTQE